jgi:SAM-dependent methyltransferase
MKLHIGCGQTLLPGFLNIDNSSSALLAGLNKNSLRLLKKMHLINADQYGFALKLKSRKKEFLRANCLKLPFKDNSVDLCYSSHMIGWCLTIDQLNGFFRELYRVLKPGAGLRLSFMDFDLLVKEFQEQKDTIAFSKRLPFSTREFDFRDKLKFLFSPNMRNGLVLNASTTSSLLQKKGFTGVVVLAPGKTLFSPALIGGIDLSQRKEESVYIECRKPVAV